MSRTTKCSFYDNFGDNIINCHSHEADELYNYMNNVLLQLPSIELEIELNKHTTNELIMMSVILDMFHINPFMIKIDNIRELIISLQGNSHSVIKININTTALEENMKIEMIDCPICFDSKYIENIFNTNCGHSFCIDCIHKYLKADVHINAHCKCPMCRTNLTCLNLQISNSYKFLGKQT